MDDSPSPSRSQAATGGSQVLRHLALLLYMTYLLWALWAMLPQHQQTAFRLRLLQSSSRVTKALARHTGAASLAHEARTGAQLYGVPYLLGRASLAAESAYQRARGSVS
jgi:hypothetical protein